MREAAKARLPSEPEANDADVLSVAVRCPDGTRCARRFAGEVLRAFADVYALIETGVRPAAQENRRPPVKPESQNPTRPERARASVVQADEIMAALHTQPRL